MNTGYHPKQWMKYILILAGFYNLAWGATAIMFPVSMLGWLGVESETTAVKFWQCIGMIVGVYGIGYLIAARAPYQHWAITLVGLLGKVFGPVGFAAAMADGSLPTSLGWTILTNDVIWWIPFAMILWGVVRYRHATDSAYETPEADDPLKELRANTGERLDDLADAKPQLVVFLRHAGCTFCRQTLADIAAQRKEITAAGCGIVLVHLGGDEASDELFFQKYGLNDVPRISDPQSRLYRQFGLDLGGFSQLFGLRVWFRGFVAGVLGGHGIGAVRGNSFQMPGVYLYHCRQILGGFRHQISSDRPDYAALARQVEVREPAIAS